MNAPSTMGIAVHSPKMKTNPGPGLWPPNSKQESFRKFPFRGLDLAFFENPKNLQEQEPETNGLVLLPSIPEAFFSQIPKIDSHFLPNWILNHSEKQLVYECQGKGASPSVYREQELPGISISFRMFLFQKNGTYQLQHIRNNTSKTDSPSYALSFDVFLVEENANVEILSFQEESSDVVSFRTTMVVQKKDSQVAFLDFSLGGFRGKRLHLPFLEGIGANLQWRGISGLHDREFRDSEVVVSHLAPSTQSHIEYRISVKDKSHHSFTGNLVIPPEVRKVNASQISRNLTLGPKARAEANPKLEVRAEDVSCSHGATVGELDSEQMFYLQSRGLSQEEAKELLVFAFFGEFLETTLISDELRDSFLEKLTQKIKN